MTTLENESEKHLDASAARALANVQIAKAKNSQEGSSKRRDDARVAKQISDRFIKRIRHRAESGHTDAICKVIDWTIRAHDREAVLDQITRRLDSLGYNLLVHKEKSFWGLRSVYKIEW